MDRLALEDALCTGLFRLIVFVVIFLLIVASNSYGTPSSDRLAISSMLDNTLDMESFDEIAGLEGTRDFLPELSQRIKVYSASSSNRYPDPESMRIIGSEVSFGLFQHFTVLSAAVFLRCCYALRASLQHSTHYSDRLLARVSLSGELHVAACHGSGATPGRPRRVHALCMDPRRHGCPAWAGLLHLLPPRLRYPTRAADTACGTARPFHSSASRSPATGDSILFAPRLQTQARATPRA